MSRIRWVCGESNCVAEAGDKWAGGWCGSAESMANCVHFAAINV